MISDILFLCLAGACMYIILDTMIKKNIFNFGKFKINLNKNTNLVDTKKFSKNNVSNKINSEEIIQNNKSKSSSSYIEKLSDENISHKFDNDDEQFQGKFISEHTEDLIDEVINQNKKSNQIILEN